MKLHPNKLNAVKFVLIRGIAMARATPLKFGLLFRNALNFNIVWTYAR